MQSGIGGLLVLNLVITFLIPGISIGGHIGGLAGGAAAGAIVLATDGPPASRWAGLAATLALVAALFTAAMWVAQNPV